MLILRNRFLWKSSCGYFGCGFFYNFDALGFELLFKNGGVNLSIPLFWWNEDSDFEEIWERNFKKSIWEIILYITVSTTISYLYKHFVLGLINSWTGDTKKLIEEEKLEEKRILLRKVQENYLKCIEKLKYYSDKNHKIELEKKEKGLLIHLAVYGKLESLLKIKKDLDYFCHRIKNAKNKKLDLTKSEYDINLYIKELKVKEFCFDIENESVDCTIAIRKKLITKEGYFHSLIFFKEKNKSKIFGIYDPVFKSEKQGNFKHILVA